MRPLEPENKNPIVLKTFLNSNLNFPATLKSKKPSLDLKISKASEDRESSSETIFNATFLIENILILYVQFMFYIIN